MSPGHADTLAALMTKITLCQFDPVDRLEVGHTL